VALDCTVTTDIDAAKSINHLFVSHHSIAKTLADVYISKAKNANGL